MHLSNGSQDLILRSVAVGPCRLQRVSKDGCKHNCSNTEYAAILRDGRTQARAAPQDEGWDMPREKAVAPARGEGQDVVAAVRSPGNISPRLGGKTDVIGTLVPTSRQNWRVPSIGVAVG